MPTFGVEHGRKIRPIDDASRTVSQASDFTATVEKLQVLSQDLILERSALATRKVPVRVGQLGSGRGQSFSQVPILLEHRKLRFGLRTHLKTNKLDSS